MIGKKINQLATELAPVSTDLTIIGDPISGVSKKITLAQLGAIFSGAVSFYTDLASFPATGDINVIYCAKDTQKLYLWSGSAYIEVFPSQALLDTYQLRSEKGNANGYASLDSGGKVPISQLPSSIMEYKGTWNAATNTPTLANGTGDTGDVYICNVAGTVNFGAGPITFAVGDYVIYSGSIWQRSSGAVGTVTSVALTVGGDAISVSGSPLTTSGTLALAFSGTTSQYIRGNGTLANFPTSLVSGSGTANRLTKWSSTSGEIVNSNILDTGITITNLNATADFFSCQFNGNPTTGRSYGVLIAAGSNASDIAFRIEDVSSSSVYFYVWGDGRVQINNIPNATTDTDRFLVSDSGVIKYRTGAELLSDIGGASASGYVPYTGATANLDLGTHTLIAAKGTFSSSGSGDTVGITHSSGSGIALNITKGGNGEGLYINKTSGSGNAATIIGTLNATTLVKSGGTSAQFLKADGSVDSTSYGTGSVTSVGLSSATSGVTIGSTPITTSGTITLAIATASGSQQGLLSSTDWTTFNNKQNALTNPVTGTGTTNYLPKFTGASTIGNSLVSESGNGINITGSAYATLTLNSTNSDGWGTNINFQQSGTAFGYIGSYGSLVGSTTKDMTIWANSGNGFRVNVNNSSTSALILNASGNLGLGVSSSAWGSVLRAFDIGTSGCIVSSASGAGGLSVARNAFYNGSAWIYKNTSTAQFYEQDAGAHIWYNAPSGTAGNAISFTQAMTLDASANLMVGTTTAIGKITFQQSTDSTVGGLAIVSVDGNGAVISRLNDGGLTFRNGGSERMRIASNGNTSIAGDLSLTPTNSALIFSSGFARIFMGTTEAMRITSAGELCVGRTSAYGAGFLVNVEGNIYASAAIVAGSSVTAASLNVVAGSSASFSFAVDQQSTFAFGSLNGKRVGIIRDATAADNGLQFGYDTVDKTGVIAGAGTSAGCGIDFYTYNGSAWGNRMRIKKDGIINLSNVPSSSAGLSSGDIYKTVAGVLMIV